MNDNPDIRPFNTVVFFVSASITIAFIAQSTMSPERMNAAINAVFGWATDTWEWLYLVTAFSLLIGCLVLMIGKSGTSYIPPVKHKIIKAGKTGKTVMSVKY